MKLGLVVVLTLFTFAAAVGCDDDPPAPDVPGSTTPQIASEVNGLFREPVADDPVDRTAQLGVKPAPIAAWDGASMVLFDIDAETARDFGPGTPGYFSPDDTHLLWARTAPFQLEGAVTVLELTTETESAIGTGTPRGWMDDRRAAFFPQGQAPATEIVDIVTGERETTGPVPVGEPFDRQTTPDGYVLRQEFVSESPFPRSIFHLEHADGEEILQFEAWHATPAGRGYLAVATEPMATGAPDERGYAEQSTNIFLVHLASGLASFIATSPAYPPNWPLIADERYVMWTENYCAPTQGRTRIFDRETSEITETDATLWLQEFTPDGLIAAGAFGADELIDAETLEYVAVIPPSEAQWSSDYRFASVGQVGGHGGLCP